MGNKIYLYAQIQGGSGSHGLSREKMNYRYCRIRPKGMHKTYFYIAGDALGGIDGNSYVLIPLGEENRIVTGKVLEVILCTEETAPFPVESTKRIIRIISMEEYGEADEDSVWDYNSDEANEIKGSLARFLGKYRGESPVYTGYTNNKPELEMAKSCGCFYCERIFDPQEIEEWIYESRIDYLGTAICPYCGNDTVIGELTGIPISKSYLHEMYVAHFQ